MAFAAWSRTSREERLQVLNRILTEYENRLGDLATAVREEMAPLLHCAGTLRCRQALTT